MKLLTTNRYPNTLSSFANLEQEINRLFAAPCSATANRSTRSWRPALEVTEDKDSLHVSAELPGVSKNNVDVTFDDGVLEIWGERKDPKGDADRETHLNERAFGNFRRTVSLPPTVDSSQAKASFKDGVLTIQLPKLEEKKPKQIAIKVK